MLTYKKQQKSNNIDNINNWEGKRMEELDNELEILLEIGNKKCIKWFTTTKNNTSDYKKK